MPAERVLAWHNDGITDLWRVARLLDRGVTQEQVHAAALAGMWDPEAPGAE